MSLTGKPGVGLLPAVGPSRTSWSVSNPQCTLSCCAAGHCNHAHNRARHQLLHSEPTCGHAEPHCESVMRLRTQRCCQSWYWQMSLLCPWLSGDTTGAPTNCTASYQQTRPRRIPCNPVFACADQQLLCVPVHIMACTLHATLLTMAHDHTGPRAQAPILVDVCRHTSPAAGSPGTCI